MEASWIVVAALAVALAAAGLPAGVRAQDEAEDEARRHFRLGQTHYENGEFAEAAAAFERAYEVSERPRLLYNAYLAYRDLQDLPNAARTLREFLVEVDDLQPGERDQLRARLEALDRALERLRGAEGDEGSEAGEGAEADEAEVAPDDTAGADGGAAAGSSAAGEAGDPGGAGGAGGGGFRPSPVGFIVGGAGLALGVGAIVTGALASSDFAQLEEECPGGVCPDRADLRDAQSRGEALAITTDVLWITGTVALAAGVALLFVLQEEEGPSGQASVGGACAADGCFGALRMGF
jgi:tetratricopeptide (TPR) repeat protein